MVRGKKDLVNYFDHNLFSLMFLLILIFSPSVLQAVLSVEVILDLVDAILAEFIAIGVTVLIVYKINLNKDSSFVEKVLEPFGISLALALFGYILVGLSALFFLFFVLFGEFKTLLTSSSLDNNDYRQFVFFKVILFVGIMIFISMIDKVFDFGHTTLVTGDGVTKIIKNSKLILGIIYFGLFTFFTDFFKRITKKVYKPYVSLKDRKK